MPKALTVQQVENYRRDGFLFPVPILSPDETAAFRRELEAVEASMGGKFIGTPRTKFYLRFPWAHRLATHPAILDAVEDLIGPDIMLYHNTVWFKEGGNGSYVSWHQDNTYFGHEPCEVLTAWVAITPVGSMPTMSPSTSGSSFGIPWTMTSLRAWSRGIPIPPGGTSPPVSVPLGWWSGISIRARSCTGAVSARARSVWRGDRTVNSSRAGVGPRRTTGQS